MNVNRFVELVDEVLDRLSKDKEPFKDNMIHMEAEDRSFCEWMTTFLAWAELSSDEDCKNFYWYLEEEE